MCHCPGLFAVVVLHFEDLKGRFASEFQPRCSFRSGQKYARILNDRQDEKLAQKAQLEIWATGPRSRGSPVTGCYHLQVIRTLPDIRRGSPIRHLEHIVLDRLVFTDSTLHLLLLVVWLCCGLLPYVGKSHRERQLTKPAP